MSSTLNPQFVVETTNLAELAENPMLSAANPPLAVDAPGLMEPGEPLRLSKIRSLVTNIIQCGVAVSTMLWQVLDRFLGVLNDVVTTLHAFLRVARLIVSSVNNVLASLWLFQARARDRVRQARARVRGAVGERVRGIFGTLSPPVRATYTLVVAPIDYAFDLLERRYPRPFRFVRGAVGSVVNYVRWWRATWPIARNYGFFIGPLYMVTPSWKGWALFDYANRQQVVDYAGAEGWPLVFIVHRFILQVATTENVLARILLAWYSAHLAIVCMFAMFCLGWARGYADGMADVMSGGPGRPYSEVINARIPARVNDLVIEVVNPEERRRPWKLDFWRYWFTVIVKRPDIVTAPIPQSSTTSTMRTRSDAYEEEEEFTPADGLDESYFRKKEGRLAHFTSTRKDSSLRGSIVDSASHYSIFTRMTFKVRSELVDRLFNDCPQDELTEFFISRYPPRYRLRLRQILSHPESRNLFLARIKTNYQPQMLEGLVGSVAFGTVLALWVVYSLTMCARPCTRRAEKLLEVCDRATEAAEVVYQETRVSALEESVPDEDLYLRRLLHNMSPELEGFYEVVLSMVRTTEWLRGADYMALLRGLIGCAQLLQAKTLSAVALASAQIYLNLGLPKWMERLVIKAEASDPIPDSARWPVIKHLTGVVSAFFSSALFKYLGLSVWPASLAIKRLFETMTTELTLCESLYKAFDCIRSSWQAFSVSGKFVDLLGQDKVLVYSDMMHDANKDLVSMDRLNLVKQGGVAMVKYKQLERKCIQLAASPEYSRNMVFASELGELRRNITYIENNVDCSKVEPLGLILVGAPGLGKSTMVNRISIFVKKHFGIDPDVNVVFTMNDTKHQSIPSYPLIVNANDWPQLKDEFSEPPVMVRYQAMVDCVAPKVETASLEEKARSVVNHTLFISSTNLKQFECTKVSAGANKLNRRYVIVSFSLSLEAADLIKKVGWTRNAWECPGFKELEKPVWYTFKRMNNDKGNVIVYDGEIFYATSSLDDALRKIRELWLECLLKNPPPKEASKECKIGICLEGCNCESEADEEEKWWVAFLDESDNRSKLMAGSLAVLLVVLAGITTYFYINRKDRGEASISGLIHGIPNEHNYVRAIYGPVLPWLGVASNKTPIGSGRVRIARDGCSLEGVVVAVNVIMLPYHFFRPDIYPNAKSRPIAKGEAFVVNDGVRDYFASYDDDKIERISRDLCLCFIILGVQPSLFTTIRDRSGPIGDSNCWMGKVSGVVSESDYHYTPCASVTGDCGRLFEVNGQIVAMHVAATTDPLKLMSKSGIAAAVDKVMISKGFDALSSRGYPCLQASLDDLGVVRKLEEAEAYGKTDTSFLLAQSTPESLASRSFKVLGVLPGLERQHMTCHRTTLYPLFNHLCEEYSTPHCGHAKLVDGKWVSQVVVRFQTQGLSATPLEFTLLKSAKYLLDLVPKPAKPLEKLSLYTALVGSGHNRFINPKDPTKSVGPRNGFLGIKKHQAFVQHKDSSWSIHPSVMSRMEYIEEQLRQGSLPLMFTKAQYKDEALPKAKTDRGKARFFYTAEVELNLILKRYFAPLVAEMLSSGLKTGFVAGLNPGNKDWHDLAFKLLRVLEGPGDAGLLASDEEKFDTHHWHALLTSSKFVFWLALKCGYPIEDAKMCVKLVTACFYRAVIIEGVVYYDSARMDSGLWVTLFLNTIIKLIHSYGFAVYMGVPCDDVETIAVGDDNLLAIMPKWRNVMTGAAMKEYYKLLGYTITPADKSPDGVIHYSKITEVDFLKRGFRCEDGIWKGPLSTESIFKSLCYSINSSVSQEERDASTLMCAVKEMYLHGREKFDQWMVTLDEGKLPHQSYEYYDEQYKKGALVLWDGSGVTTPLGDNELLLEARQATREAIARAYDKAGKFEMVAEGCHYRFNSPSINQLNSTTPTDLPVGSGVTVLAADPSVKERKALAPLRGPDGLELSDFFRRKRLINTTTISPGPYELGSDLEVKTLWVTGAVATVLEQYQYMRGTLGLQFKLTGGSSVAGYVRISARPVMNEDAYGNGNYSDVDLGDYYVRSSQLPHVDLNLSEVCDKSLVLPFPKSNLYDGVHSLDWVLRIERMFYASVNTSVTAPNLTLQVFAWYEDVELLNLVSEADSSEGNPRVLSNLLRFSSYVAGQSGGEYGALASVVLKAGEKVAYALGWSRPMVEPTDAVVVRTQGNPCLMSGQPDMSFHLGSNPAVAASVNWKQYPLGEEDDTNVKRCLARSSQLAKDWDVAESIQVFPTVLRQELGTLPEEASHLTSLAFYSSMFKYYRGPIKIKLLVITSPLVRWKFAVVVVPPGVASPLTYTGDATYVSYIVDVVGTTEYEFDVPLMWYAPWREVPFPGVGTPGLYPTLTYYPLMAPSGPAATTRTPQIDVWIQGSPTFELAVPSLDVANRMIVAESSTAYSFGEDFQDFRLLCKRLNPVMCATAVVHPPTDPWAINLVSVPADGFRNVGDADGNTVINNLGINRSNWSYANWLKLAYIGYNGGTVWRVRLDQLGSVGLSNYPTLQWEVFMSKGKTGLSSYGAPFKYPDGTADGSVPYTGYEMIEVSLPSRNPQLFKSSLNQVDGADDIMCLKIHSMTGDSLEPATETYTRFNLWSGAMDDFTVGGYLAAPCVYRRYT